MGGAIALAIVTSVFNGIIRPKLLPILTFDQYSALLQSSTAIDSFDPSLQQAVRTILSDAYNVQFRIMIGFGAAQIPAALLTWTRRTEAAPVIAAK